MNPATRLVQFDAAPRDPWRPLVTPLYQTACFEQPSPLEFGPYDYTRSGNPTRHVLERQLADLEGAHSAHAFASGMAALSTVTRLAAGGRIVAGDDLYGGTYRLLTRVCAELGIEIDFVDASNLDELDRALERPARLVLIETPTNPLLRIVDLRAAAGICHKRGALLCVDSSLMTPLLQQPLALGADLVVHSATKFLCGHGDVTAGVVAARDAALAERIAFLQNAEGGALAPFECWLLLRGLKTLALRVRAQERTARRLARLLVANPSVTRVHYPGLASHPGRALHASQSLGAGAVLSFETGSLERSRELLERLELFTIAVSFGSVRSQASLPCCMSHASIPAEARRARGLPEDLVRLSIGIEDADDLRRDLTRALETVAQREVCASHAHARSAAET
jgi:cysteine-S-conjugate beta-lyase